MDCTHFQDHITAYLDGELVTREKAEFAAHRLSCSPCRELFNDIRTTLVAVGEYAQVDHAQSLEGLEHRIVDATSAGEMLSCTEFDKMIESYFDGVILGPTFQNFQAHFDGCWKCRRLLRGIEEAKEMLRDVKDEVEVPTHLSTRIMAATVGSEAETFFDKLSRSLKAGQWVAAFIIFAASSFIVNWRYGSVENLATQKQEQLNQTMMDTGTMAIAGMQFLSTTIAKSQQSIKTRRKVEPATPQASTTPQNSQESASTQK